MGQALKPKARRRGRKSAPPTDPNSPVKERAAESFRSRPFDPDRSVSERRRSAPRDPESQQVLSEQADQAHQDTLRTFGLWLEDEGWRDLEEVDGAIDLHALPPRGIGGGKRTLFEIKSIRPTTERGRVRGGLAQLLEYRLLLGTPNEHLCLVSDRPISERRLRLLDSLTIGHAYVDAGKVVPSGTDPTRLLFPRNG